MISTPKFKRIQCLDRALDLLEAAASGKCHSVAELAAAVHLNEGTAYNIVKTLMARGAVAEVNGAYGVGPVIGMLAEKWDIAASLPVLVRPILLEIGHILGNDHVSIAIRTGEGVESFMMVSDDTRRFRNQFLSRSWDDPMLLAAGRVMVAFGNEKDWMKQIERHLHGGGGEEHYKLYKQLEQIRNQNGIALTMHSEHGEAYGTAAVPLFSPGGALLGAIGTSCEASEATSEHLELMLQTIQNTIGTLWRPGETK